jgi:hypothetical protein
MQTPIVYLVTLLAAAAGAIALAWWLGTSPGLRNGALGGFVAGLAIAGGSLGLNYAFAGRGLSLWLIDAGFHVLRFTVFGVIIGLMQ